MKRFARTTIQRLFEIKLPFAYNALEPIISEDTLHFHFDKHHTGYVTKLNDLVETDDYAHLKDMSMEEIVLTTDDASIFNLAAQTWNHSFFWCSLAEPDPDRTPGPVTTKLLEDAFGSVEIFKSAFEASAGAHFGSGWNWLVFDPFEEELQIMDTHDAGNPMSDDMWPVLVVDLWEHAYYLDYQNARPEYLDAVWDIVNWDGVEELLLRITGGSGCGATGCAGCTMC